MTEKLDNRRFNQSPKSRLMRGGALALALVAFGTPTAEAKPLGQSAASSAESGRAQEPLTPKRLQAVRDGAKVLLEMHANIRPDVVSSAVLELGAGTSLAYGPSKNSPGEKVPKGKVALMEFPQLAIVDGRIMARGLLNNGAVDDKTVNAMDSRWVAINSKSVVFHYLQTMDANKGYSLTIPVRPGEGNNLASAANWFQGPPELMELGLLTSSLPVKSAIGQEKYWAADFKPGPKPATPDITKYGS